MADNQNKTPKKESGTGRRRMGFKCPYCFTENYEDEVLFRATFGYTADELIEIERDRSIPPEQKERLKLFECYTDSDGNGKIDEDLMKFWRKRGGEGYKSGNWNYPHIDPLDKETFEQMTIVGKKGDRTAGEDRFVRDADGFITQVLDIGSETADITERLCRKCHNRLPLPDYGKYPVMFIGVVGITSSGKTVYLMQLLKNLASAVHNTGYYLGPGNLSVIQSEKNEWVALNSQLPGSTDPTAMRPPLAVDLLNRADPQKSFTIVFYDIAGENCVVQYNKNEAVTNNTAAQFIANSHALMFLIDPNQLPAFSANAATNGAEMISSVISAVQLLRTTLNGDKKDWDNIPVAAVLTKSDRISRQQLIPKAFENAPAEQQDFNRGEFFQIYDSIKQKLQNSTVLHRLSAFNTLGLFAVSAITCGVQSRIKMYRNSYVLSEDDERRARDGKLWFQNDDPLGSPGWDARDEEEQEHYRACPLRKKDTHERITPCSKRQLKSIAEQEHLTVRDVLERENKIETDICAVNAENSEDKIWLTVGMIRTLQVLSYPVGDPQPRRIEDPLRWILWRLQRIGPEFLPPLPRKKNFLESKREYDDYLRFEYPKEREDAWYLFFENDVKRDT